MNRFALALAGALATTVQVACLSPCGAQTDTAAAAPDPNDPTEQEFQNLLAQDDAAQVEVDQWIRDEQALAAKGAGLPPADVSRRIRQRFEPVRQAYQAFLKNHPDHVRARIAYGSFLNDLQDETGAEQQWQQALTLAPRNPAVWNNLAKHYAEVGPVRKAFEYYAKAIELNPREPLYYHNLGNTVYLFRKQAMEFYQLTEQQVCEKALQLYTKALALAPTNFPFASDLAQTYYAIKPTRTDEALRAWTNALAIAQDDIEREGVYLHFARLKLAAGRFAEARADLKGVTNGMYTRLKSDLARNLTQQELPAPQTNPPPLPQVVPGIPTAPGPHR